MGKLIVIEGLDGSGKATQAELLATRLRGEGMEISRLRFPRYEEDSSLFVRMYLKGEFGDKPEDVNCYAASMLYAADRYISFKKHWGEEYARGKVFIADRYTTSNAVHQMSKLKKEEWDDYLVWLRDFEYTKLAIPPPDMVFYLDIPPDVSESLMVNRYDGDREKMDIHERDMEFQRKSREAALYCGGKEGWMIIGCCENSQIRNKEEIAGEIYEKARRNLT